MRCRDGTWAAFDRDNTRRIAYSIPFADFGAMIDPPTEDVTAHVLEMLAALGYGSRRSHVAARPRLPAADADSRRFVVRPLGRQSRLRDVVRIGCPGGVCKWTAIDMLAARALAALCAEPRRWLGRDCSFVRRPVICGRRPEHAVANGMGGARATDRRECGRAPGLPDGLAFLRDRQTAGTGRSPEAYGHGFPARLLHQLPPVSSYVSDVGSCAGDRAGSRKRVLGKGS